jgi:hypothetical protein
LQLTRLAQLYWAGHPMIGRGIPWCTGKYSSMNVYPSFMSTQDLGSNVDLASDHGLVCCNPVLKMVNLGDLGKMDVWAGLEICCAAMVEARILEFVQCSNLVLCFGKVYLLLCFGILSWGTAGDAKLLQLFRTPHNGVDATKLDMESVKAIHSKFFPEKKYANFAPLYRGKARAFNVSQTLDGHRKGKCTSSCLIRTSRLDPHTSSRLKSSKGS